MSRDLRVLRRNTRMRRAALDASARIQLRLRVTDHHTLTAPASEVGDPVRTIEDELAWLGAYDEAAAPPPALHKQEPPRPAVASGGAWGS